jgi:hypothetical protein
MRERAAEISGIIGIGGMTIQMADSWTGALDQER